VAAPNPAAVRGEAIKAMQSGTRALNAVDFWRGLALVMIFIDHIPGNAYSYLTLRNFAISDAAELFVFLAGWSCSMATGGTQRPDPAPRIAFRLLSRAVEIYRAQIMISSLALAMLATTAITRNNPLYLEWHNAATAFYDPVRGVIGTVLLSYQLGYFNIPPLYVVLLVMAPVMIYVGRSSLALMLALSAALYAWAIVTAMTPPSWPAQDSWYLNPFTWQILFFAGFAASEASQSSDGFSALVRRAWPFAAAIVCLGLAVRLLDYAPDPAHVPRPRLLFVFDKTFLSPARVLSMLALAVTFYGAFEKVNGRMGPGARWLCALGRNSLPVFCIASLASLAGQIARFVWNGSILADTLMVVCGLVLMVFTSWFVEWRARNPGSR